MTVDKSLVLTPVLGQPDAALISGETLLFPQMSSAKVCVDINVVAPMVVIAIRNMMLAIFLIFMILLCGSC